MRAEITRLRQQLTVMARHRDDSPKMETTEGERRRGREAETERRRGRHPDFRLAMLIPWLGPAFPRWFPLFIASCTGSDYLVDWLIFHEDAAIDVPPESVPANVHFHSLGKHGMGALFGVQLARLTGAENLTHTHVRLLQHAFATWPYSITEYKPTYGDVFAGACPRPSASGVVRRLTSHPGVHALPCAQPLPHTAARLMPFAARHSTQAISMDTRTGRTPTWTSWPATYPLSSHVKSSPTSM